MTPADVLILETDSEFGIAVVDYRHNERIEVCIHLEHSAVSTVLRALWAITDGVALLQQQACLIGKGAITEIDAEMHLHGDAPHVIVRARACRLDPTVEVPVATALGNQSWWFRRLGACNE